MKNRTKESETKRREIPVNLTWEKILKDAVNVPGTISKAYNAFYGYSLGNRLAAISQCITRNLEPGPIATFQSWREKGRYVSKGESALFLCVPRICKGTKEVDKDGSIEKEEFTYTKFYWAPRWFVLSQTNGQNEIQPLTVGAWDRFKALSVLGINEIPFLSMNGNMQGYAEGHSIAINPVGAMLHKTTFHELAHVVMGHTNEDQLSDDDKTPVNIQEVEAEAVALICCESLGLPGAEYSRGYIQHWYSEKTIPEKSVQKIFKAADEILKAGLPENNESIPN